MAVSLRPWCWFGLSLCLAALAGCGGGAVSNQAAAKPAPATAAIQPVAATVTEGQNAAFTATLSSPSGASWSATGGNVTGTATSATFTAGTAPGSYQVTVTAGGASASATVTVVAPPPPPTPPAAPARLFTANSANWLYSAATGTGINISTMVQSIPIQLNTHDQGFDYPVQYTDGSHGCTNFTDTLVYNLNDHLCVPNPAGAWAPSVGGWGANDGHLVVVNTATGDYYDFWKLTVNANGRPTSTNVGAIVSGNLATSNGTPGTTAASITGLAGDILSGELDCATCLNHALNVVVPGNMNSNQVGNQAPAVKTDGSVGGAIFREGAKLVFDPSIDVASLNVSTAVKALMRAMQLYGAVITDQTGGNGIGIYTSLPSKPDLTGIGQLNQHLLIYY